MRAAAHFRDIALFLNIHVMNKPEFSARIFQSPSPFNLETGDLIDPVEIERVGKVLEALIAWTNRIGK